MDDERFEFLKRTVRERLEKVYRETEAALQAIEEAMAPLDAQKEDAQSTLGQMDRASAKLPLGFFAYFYAKGMKRAGGPAVHLDGSISDEYQEISEETVRDLRAKYMAPAVDALDKVFPSAHQVLIDVQNYALTLRFFSNAEPLLAQYAHVLAPPWFQFPKFDDLTPKGEWRIHYAYASLSYRLAPHIEIIARRRSSINSLHILRAKLKALRSLIETSLTEIDFATPRSEPAAVPSTWYDNSVRIGNNVTVEASAVGSEANLQRRLV